MTRATLFLILFGWLLLPIAGRAQTLSISGGIKSFASLTNTAVTMTGRCELHLTDAASPLPGCHVNLNSPDAWLFLENVRPSAVISTYLSQITVSGAAAVSGTNVRVVEYAMGTVIIPHPPTFQPMQVFSGTQFSGSSLQLGLYTIYNNANLGALYQGISSFTLKRGYMATVATQANGSGNSRVYVAQDGDITVSAVPSSLSGGIAFVRVFPWSWTGKKGWAGAAQMLVDPLWSYDWDNVATSTPDTEYVPMRHDTNWDAFANINNKHGSTQVLGFNEPDSSTQANMTVAGAISMWPALMASGLRLGSPAPTDGGSQWLYDFIDQADALNYRVDYVAVHFYRCGQTSAQLFSYLQAVHNRTKRPVWVTEFNNGANWTSCAQPTLAQNAAAIGSWMDMMESTPWIERYSVYNWVQASRAMVDDSGALTPAGIVYLDKTSHNAFQQNLPAGAGTDADYQFSGGATDSTGNGNDALLAGAPTYVSGKSGGPAIQMDGVNDYVQIPANVGSGTDFSFAAWVKWNGGANYQRIFDFGDGTTNYLFLTPSSFSKTLRFAITTGGNTTEQRVETSGLPTGVWTHVAVTLTGTTVKLYVNGALAATNSSLTLNPSLVAAKYDYLGKSQFPGDPLFSGQMQSVMVTGYAMTAAQVAALAQPAVSGTLSMAGRANMAQPLTFTLTPTGATTGVIITQTVTPAADGTFALVGIPTGTYLLGIKGSQCLKKDITVSTVTGTAVIPNTITLLAGDLNGDNQVAGADLAMVRAAYGSAAANGTTPASPNWNPLCDLNGDGLVTATDMAMVRANYGKLGDP